MPIPKRWFHCSRDINHDPEVWELTDRYGDRSLRIWLEIMAWVDRTENRQIPLAIQWFSSLAQATKTNSKTVIQVVTWMIDRRWVTIRGPQDVVKRWVDGIHALSINWPKNHRRLSVNSSETAHKQAKEWAETGRTLTLCTANYSKYNRRPAQSGGAEGTQKGGPILDYPRLHKKKIAGSTTSTPAAPSTVKLRVELSDDQFVDDLRHNPAYKYLDIDHELGKMDAWLKTPKGKRRKKTRQFVVNWLNNAADEQKPLGPTAPASRLCTERVHDGDGRRLKPCGKPIALDQPPPVRSFCAEHLQHRQRIDAHLANGDAR